MMRANRLANPAGKGALVWQAAKSLGKLAPEREGNASFADNVRPSLSVNGDRNWHHGHSLLSVQETFLCRRHEGG